MHLIDTLKIRLMDISFRHKLSHLGSCMTALPIIQTIYALKEPDDIFILSSGHAGLALYVVLESYLGVNAEKLLEKHGVHPNRDVKNGIICSSGSLGSGLPIAIGHALADDTRTVHCLISDGECAEGSIWESLQFIGETGLSNIKVYVN